MAREATSAEKAVFGHDVLIGEDGRPVEKGFGSVATKTAAVLQVEAEAEAKAKEALTKLEERAAEEKRIAEKQVVAESVEF